MVFLTAGRQATLNALRAGCRDAFGADLFALYVYGAITFPETEGIVDLDYHAILERPPTGTQVTAYEAAHARLGFEHAPWGADLDGWVILRSQATASQSPTHVNAGIADSSWALHRAHWLAGRCIVLWGPPPATFVAAPGWAEIETDLYNELEFARRSPHDAFAVLNACRVLHSVRTRNAVQSGRLTGRSGTCLPSTTPRSGLGWPRTEAWQLKLTRTHSCTDARCCSTRLTQSSAASRDRGSASLTTLC